MSSVLWHDVRGLDSVRDPFLVQGTLVRDTLVRYILSMWFSSDAEMSGVRDTLVLDTLVLDILLVCGISSDICTAPTAKMM